MVIASRIFLPEPAAASFRLAALARALRDRGADVTVVTATVPGAEYDELDGVRVRRMPVKRDREGYVRGYVSYASYDVPLAGRLLGVRRPDVIVVEPPPTTGVVVWALSGLRRVPYVYYAADIWSDAAASTGAPAGVLRTLARIERHALQSAAAVLSVSEGVTERLSELGVTQRVTTVGNGIDLGSFGPSGEAAKLSGPYLLYAGTASEFQGATIFVDAFQRILPEHPDARLVFIGQGSDFKRIAQVAANMPTKSILVEGRQPPDAAARWLRGAHASVVSIRPDVGYDLAKPTKMYASAACGTPVLFVGPEPTRRFVSENRLGKQAPYDVTAVATAMSEALSEPPDENERRRLAAWAESSVSLAAIAETAADVVLGVVDSLH